MDAIVDIEEMLKRSGVTLPPVVRSRDRPVKPVMRHVVFHGGGMRRWRDDNEEPRWDDSDMTRWRELLIHTWGSGPKLCWVTYNADPSTADVSNLAVKRMIRWSYRLGYGGLMIVSLYPVMMPDRGHVQVWRASGPNMWNLVVNAATLAGVASKNTHCTDIVVATGPLTDAEVSDFDDWLAWFRTARKRRKTRWYCIGCTDEGWPLPPAGRGRTAPPEHVTLQRWQTFPITREVQYGTAKSGGDPADTIS